MKIKGHHIAKLILIIVLSFTFSYCLLMINTTINEEVTNWKKNKTELLSKDNGKYSNYITSKIVKFTDVIVRSSDTEIIIYTTLFSILMVIMIDITAGVGRTSPLDRKK